MTAEAELLLMNASRAQLVREVIRPALAQGEIVLCDRFYDSTTAYQGHGRQLDLALVQRIIDFAVGSTRPDLTLLLHVPLAVSQARRLSRHAELLASSRSAPAKKGASPVNSPSKLRDRMEEADAHFFARVEKGYQSIAGAEPQRIRVIDATQSVEEVRARVWENVEPLLRPS
jgi:dTMP kinase